MLKRKRTVMADLLQIACPGCGAVFELPPELGGQLGECTECDAIFEIPRVDNLDSGDLDTTDTGAIKVQESGDADNTNTVKLSRTSIGMVPDVKDNFNFDVVKQQPEVSKPAPSASGKKNFKRNTQTRSRPRPSSRKKTPPKPKKQWWQFWK
jgi:hypothetical protein